MSPEERKLRQREASRRWYAIPENRDKMRATSKRWMSKPENQDKHREAVERWYNKPGNRERERERAKKYWASQPDSRERRKKAHDELLKRRPMYVAMMNAKIRAKKMNLPFDITDADLVVPDSCPILGLKLEFARGKGPEDNSPSVDRIRPERGYVKGNVRVISNRANRLRSNRTLEEMRAQMQANRFRAATIEAMRLIMADEERLAEMNRAA